MSWAARETEASQKNPELVWAGWRPWISVSCPFIVLKKKGSEVAFYLFSSELPTLLNFPLQYTLANPE
jgi:hypothetical protein